MKKNVLKKIYILTCLALFNVFVVVNVANAEVSEDYQKQITACSNELKSNKKDASLYIKRAELYIKLYKANDDEKNKKPLNSARKDYSQAIKLNKKSAEAYMKRGLLYKYSQTIETLGEAFKDFSQVIKLEPNNPDYKDAYINRARICYDEVYGLKLHSMLNSTRSFKSSIAKFLNQAVKDYTKALEFEPNNWEYYTERGKSYSGLLNYKSAVADFTKAIELNPDETPIYLERGRLYEKMMMFDEARADYNKIIDSKSSVNFMITEAREGLERMSNR